MCLLSRCGAANGEMAAPSLFWRIRRIPSIRSIALLGSHCLFFGGFTEWMVGRTDGCSSVSTGLTGESVSQGALRVVPVLEFSIPCAPFKRRSDKAVGRSGRFACVLRTTGQAKPLGNQGICARPWNGVSDKAVGKSRHLAPALWTTGQARQSGDRGILRSTSDTASRTIRASCVRPSSGKPNKPAGRSGYFACELRMVNRTRQSGNQNILRPTSDKKSTECPFSALPFMNSREVSKYESFLYRYGNQILRRQD